MTSILTQFQNEKNENIGPALDLPLNATLEQLDNILYHVISNNNNQNETELTKGSHAFYVKASGDEIHHSLLQTLKKTNAKAGDKELGEKTLEITVVPLNLYQVKPISRCVSTLSGHADTILTLSFSPNYVLNQSILLATGGADGDIRFWNMETLMPHHNSSSKAGKGHSTHVLALAWAPNGKILVSGDRLGFLRAWDPITGKQIGKLMKGHRKWITSISFEPMHRNVSCERFASSAKCGSIAVWNVRTGTQLASLSGHTDSVECVKWGGQGVLYSASRDRTIKVWAMEGNKEDGSSMPWNGLLIKTLVGHAHRINFLAINVDHACRTGPFSPKQMGGFASDEEMRIAAQEKYDQTLGGKENRPEILVSASDDFTLYVWEPLVSKKPITRLTGHVQPVNHIAFSPDGRYFASASFDKKVKVWDGRNNGKFICTLNGHVGAVYQVCWSADSRYLVSASKDGTVKLWDHRTPTKVKATLPGHADEVYALDWAPNGVQVASGSKDRTIKIWQH